MMMLILRHVSDGMPRCAWCGRSQETTPSAPISTAHEKTFIYGPFHGMDNELIEKIHKYKAWI